MRGCLSRSAICICFERIMFWVYGLIYKDGKCLQIICL